MLKKRSKVKRRRGLFGLKGRSLFVQSSRKQERTAKKISLLMRGILSFLIIVVLTLLLVFLFGYLIPYLQTEFGQLPGESSTPPISATSTPEPIQKYDALGLPIYDNSIALQLINSKHTVDAETKPETEKVNGVQVNVQIATALRLMVQSAKDEGYLLSFTQGFLSYEEQEALYEGQVSVLRESEGLSLVMARSNAKKYVPVAGESDFQTGFCIRLEADKDTFRESKTYEWLNMNMGKYGFVFRYPEKSSLSTGLHEDYTVIRYVGSANAEKMRQLALCLEEYVNYLENQ